MWKRKYDGGSQHCVNCKHSTEDFLNGQPNSFCTISSLKAHLKGIDNDKDMPLEECWEPNK